MDHLSFFLVFAAALIFSVIFTPLAKITALKYKIMDKPDKHLKTHKKPVPYLGGAAIFFAFLFTLIGERLIVDHTLKGLVGIISGSLIIFSLGLIDDIKKLSVPLKFCIQILAAVVVIICNIQINFLGNDIINKIVTVLWIVGVTNAFNLLDIMDGLSSGVAFIASAAFLAIGILGGQYFSPLAAAALAGATIGFLFYNFPPAKIFMGDAGSLFIGFVLAVLSISEKYSFRNDFAVLVPIIIMGIPIFDTLFVMWMRWKAGRPVYYGSPDHVVLRLKRAGLSVKQVLIIVYSTGILLSLLSIFITQTSLLTSVVIYLLLVILAIFFSFRLSKIP